MAPRAALFFVLTALACSAAAAPWSNACPQPGLGAGALRPLAAYGDVDARAPFWGLRGLGVHQVGGSPRKCPAALAPGAPSV